MTATAPEGLADHAAPLDALLVDAAMGPLRRFVPGSSTARFALRLASRPRTTTRRLGSLAAELGRVAAGTSALTPSTRDRRFADPAWQGNPVLRRVVQAYLASGLTAQQLLDDADLDWRDDARVRFAVENLIEAFAPSNLPLVNPASAKAAIETGGTNFASGARSLVRDLSRPPRVPEMVDTGGFQVGKTLATSPGAVVLRTELFELIQYGSRTETVREVPMLVVPPTINKFYVLDLAPGRSIVEHLVQNGQQVFMISWRNPDARHAAWGIDTYVRGILDALEAVERITGSARTLLTGVCSGGILSSIAAAHLAVTGRQERLAGLTLLVTVLDNARAGTTAAMVDERVAEAAKARSRRRGYLDGRALAEVFAWLRPGDLIWNYWVNNYLLGRRPPAFDVLFWNSDTTRMTAQLHADFVDLAVANSLVRPGELQVLGTPVDLSKISTDAYVVAGIADHITPWQSCYRTTQLLGGQSRFVLSTSGHIAALVNPPTNKKATFQLNKDNPPDVSAWLREAETQQGSWWSDHVEWLRERGGSERPAPERLGGGGLVPVGDAPGTYVCDC